MADTKISALPAANALGGTEKIPGVQSSANVAITPDQIRSYIYPARPVSIFDYLTAAEQADVLARTGLNDLTSKFAAMFTAMSSTGSAIYIPSGRYVTAGGLTIDKPFYMYGDGIPGLDDTGALELVPGGSQIECNAAGAKLFTVTAQAGQFKHLALVETHGTPTSGSSAVLVSGPGADFARVDFDHILLWGFYNALDMDAGECWRVSQSLLYMATNYAIRIRNTVNPDAGDYTIALNSIFPKANAGAGVRLESSGGAKIFGNKIMAMSGKIVNGFLMDIDSDPTSVELTFQGNTVDQTSGSPIKIVNGFPNINITGNILKAPSTGDVPCADIANCSNLMLGGNSYTGNGAAVKLTDVTLACLGKSQVNTTRALDLAGTCSDIQDDMEALPLAVSGLPDASMLTKGCQAWVTDALAGTIGNVVVGGGTHSVPVISNGTNWVHVITTTGNYSAAAQQFFDRLATQPDSTRKTAYAAMIDAIVTADAWDDLDVFNVYVGADEATALTNLKSASFGTTNPDSLAYTADAGYASVASGALLVDYPNDHVGQYTQNSASYFVWTTHSTGASPEIVRMGSAARDALFPFFTDNKMYLNLNSAADDPTGVAVTPAAGLYGGSRTNTTLNYYQNGVNIGNRTDTAQAVQGTAEFEVMYSNYPGSCLAFGAGAGLSDAKMTAIHAALNTFIAAL